MAQLRIHLFGTPRVTVDGAPTPVEERKALALLAYLAVSGRPQRRETLAALLWTTREPAQALANLRHTIWALRKAGLGDWLAADRETVGLRPDAWVDLVAFQQALDAGRIVEALTLAEAEPLIDLAVDRAPAFVQWCAIESQRLTQLLTAALAQHATELAERGDPAAGLPYARRRLAIEPTDAAAQRLVLRLSTQHHPDTAAISTGASDLPAADNAASLPEPTGPNRALQVQAATSFVGREAELAELEATLLQPACRLLTLLGPGGIGKTRLAVVLAHRSRAAFPDGVVFVPLQGITHAAQIGAALAEALALPLQGAEPPIVQVAHALREQAQLIIFDNLEHVLDGRDDLAMLIATAPRVTLLVTSREALKLKEEWLFPLEGLALPPGNTPDAALTSHAMQLFNARALQVQPAFDAVAEAPAVAQICRLVAGMPLAIELAAAWVRTLRCAEIAAELAENLALLETDLHNVPARHRSMHAVFAQTWTRLAPATQNVLMRLSVFHGSFTRAAAAQIAGATLAALAQLSDLALLRRDQDGRYTLHELLRQDAAQRLSHTPEAAAAAETAYAAYYGAFLSTQYVALMQGRQRAAIRAIADELENLRIAWPTVVARTGGVDLFAMAHVLSTYYFFCGPYQEGIDVVGQAIVQLEGDPDPVARQALAGMLNDAGLFEMRVGRLNEAEAHFSASVAILEREGAPPLPGISTDPAVGLAILALIRGDYGAASQFADEVQIRSERHHLVGNLPYAWYLRTEAALAQGLHQAAQRSAHAALGAAEAAGDDWFRAYILNQLGQVSVALGLDDEAEQQFAQSYELREAFNDPQGMAVALLNRGALALQRGDTSTAVELYQRSRTIAERIGDRGAVASALVGIGAAAAASGEVERARQAFRAAMEIAVALEYLHVLLYLVTQVASLQLAGGQPAIAAELLTGVLRDPASTRETSHLAQEVLLRCEAALPPEPFALAVERGQRLSRDTLLDRLRTTLLRPIERAAFTRTAPLATAQTVLTAESTPNAALPEPLSERELSILAAIAEGLSNQAIADRLFLSIGTVKWYTGQIYGKLSVQTRTQAIAQARTLKIIS